MTEFKTDIIVPDSTIRVGYDEPYVPPFMGDTYFTASITGRGEINETVTAGVQGYGEYLSTGLASIVATGIHGLVKSLPLSTSVSGIFAGGYFQSLNNDGYSSGLIVQVVWDRTDGMAPPEVMSGNWMQIQNQYTHSTPEYTKPYIYGQIMEVVSYDASAVYGDIITITTEGGYVVDSAVGMSIQIVSSGAATPEAISAVGLLVTDTSTSGIYSESIRVEGVDSRSSFQGSISVGSAAPDWVSGVFTVHGDMGFTDTTTAGLRLLNATTVERYSFATPLSGQIYFDSTESDVQYYDGANWLTVDTSALWEFSSLKTQNTLSSLADKIDTIQTTTIKVVVVGDSIGLFGWVERMANILMNVHNPLRSAGVRFPYNNLYFQFVPGGVGTPSSTGASRSSVVLADGQVIEHNPTDKTTSLKILYTRRPDGGDLLVYRNGALLHTIDTSGTLAYSQLYETSVAAASLYEWSFEADGGVVQLELVNFMAGNEAKGFEFWNFCKAGSSLDDVLAYPDASLDGLAALDPDVVIIALGTNNTGDLTDNLNDYLDAVTAVTGAIQVVSIPYVSDQFTIGEAETMRAVAMARHLPIIDFASVIGNYSSDASIYSYEIPGIDHVHPTTHMSQTMGTYAAGIIGCDPNMAAVSNSLQTYGTYRGKMYHIVNADGVVGGSIEIGDVFGKPFFGIKELYSDANYEVILSSSSLLNLLGYDGGGLIIGGGGGDSTWSVLYRSGALALKTNSTLDMSTKRILDVGAPTAIGDATNKAYVDARGFTKGQSYAIMNNNFL